MITLYQCAARRRSFLNFHQAFNSNFHRSSYICEDSKTGLNRRQSDNQDNELSSGSSDSVQNNPTEFPEEPTTCCMSGCANCVWLDYAEKLSIYYKDGGVHALKEINEKVSDPNIKSFLLHELRMKQKIE